MVLVEGARLRRRLHSALPCPGPPPLVAPAPGVPDWHTAILLLMLLLLLWLLLLLLLLLGGGGGRSGGRG